MSLFFLKIVNHTAWIAQCWCRQNQQTCDFSIPCSKNQSGLSSSSFMLINSTPKTFLSRLRKYYITPAPKRIFHVMVTTYPTRSFARRPAQHQPGVCNFTVASATCHSIQFLSQELLNCTYLFPISSLLLSWKWGLASDQLFELWSEWIAGFWR